MYRLQVFSGSGIQLFSFSKTLAQPTATATATATPSLNPTASYHSLLSPDTTTQPPPPAEATTTTATTTTTTASHAAMSAFLYTSPYGVLKAITPQPQPQPQPQGQPQPQPQPQPQGQPQGQLKPVLGLTLTPTATSSVVMVLSSSVASHNERGAHLCSLALTLLSTALGSLAVAGALGSEISLAKAVHSLANPLESLFSVSRPSVSALVGGLRVASTAGHAELHKALASLAGTMDGTPYAALRVGGVVIAATDGWRSIHPHESLVLGELLHGQAGGRDARHMLSSETHVYLPKTHTHAPNSPWRLMAFNLIAGVQLAVLGGAKFRTREVEDTLLVPALLPHVQTLRSVVPGVRRGVPPSVVLDRGVLAYILLDTTNVAFHASFDLSPPTPAQPAAAAAQAAPPRPFSPYSVNTNANRINNPRTPGSPGGFPGSPSQPRFAASPAAGQPALLAPVSPTGTAFQRQQLLCQFYAEALPLLKPSPALGAAHARAVVSISDAAVHVAVVRSNIRLFLLLHPAVPSFAHIPLAHETLDTLLPHAYYLAPPP